MRGVFYPPKVPGKVREILEYYEEISPKLADDLWDEIREAIESARSFPERHHFDSSGRRRRNLKKFPYHFLFGVFDDRIRITAVRHNRRDPSYGSRRQ